MESYRERLLRVLLYLETHLDEEVTLEQLAAVACFSPYHFHRIFTGMIGEPVKEHVRRLRLERSALRLRATEAPILELALAAGYETHESFTRAFQAHFGQTPSEFRKDHGRLRARPGLLPEVPSGGPQMEVRIERLEGIRVAYVRHVGPYDQVHSAWAKLCGWAGPRGLLGPATRFIGVCHDDPEITPPERLRYDAAVPVPAGVAAQGEIGVQDIPAGDYAISTHRGPYDQLKHTYARLCGEWLPTSGREPRDGPSLEFYLNSPDRTRPEDLLTDVCVPLAERGV